ncbi:hypothetical protein BD410DRAFT_898084 [Rickenella mellea]|uniref:LIM zinc-binding domain-containing protein n=1 Tax=Rickenella mellea TaxID=50990 RepID=A0A4Y7Q6B5_9AGAM|nr:hypothetical protein BD410DRAFT_898084 [Rickenella mellea]
MSSTPYSPSAPMNSIPRQPYGYPQQQRPVQPQHAPTMPYSYAQQTQQPHYDYRHQQPYVHTAAPAVRPQSAYDAQQQLIQYQKQQEQRRQQLVQHYGLVQPQLHRQPPPPQPVEPPPQHPLRSPSHERRPLPNPSARPVSMPPVSRSPQATYPVQLNNYLQQHSPTTRATPSPSFGNHANTSPPKPPMRLSQAPPSPSRAPTAYTPWFPHHAAKSYSVDLGAPAGSPVAPIAPARISRTPSPTKRPLPASPSLPPDVSRLAFGAKPSPQQISAPVGGGAFAQTARWGAQSSIVSTPVAPVYPQRSATIHTTTAHTSAPRNGWTDSTQIAVSHPEGQDEEDEDEEVDTSYETVSEARTGGSGVSFGTQHTGSSSMSSNDTKSLLSISDFDARSTRSGGSSVPPSPQYGIRDLPNRSPQYGILDLPPRPSQLHVSDIPPRTPRKDGLPPPLPMRRSPMSQPQVLPQQAEEQSYHLEQPQSPRPLSSRSLSPRPQSPSQPRWQASADIRRELTGRSAASARTQNAQMPLRSQTSPAPYQPASHTRHQSTEARGRMLVRGEEHVPERPHSRIFRMAAASSISDQSPTHSPTRSHAALPRSPSPSRSNFILSPTLSERALPEPPSAKPTTPVKRVPVPSPSSPAPSQSSSISAFSSKQGSVVMTETPSVRSPSPRRAAPQVQLNLNHEEGRQSPTKSTTPFRRVPPAVSPAPSHASSASGRPSVLAQEDIYAQTPSVRSPSPRRAAPQVQIKLNEVPLSPTKSNTPFKRRPAPPPLSRAASEQSSTDALEDMQTPSSRRSVRQAVSEYEGAPSSPVRSSPFKRTTALPSIPPAPSHTSSTPASTSMAHEDIRVHRTSVRSPSPRRAAPRVQLDLDDEPPPPVARRTPSPSPSASSVSTRASGQTSASAASIPVFSFSGPETNSRSTIGGGGATRTVPKISFPDMGDSGEEGDRQTGLQLNVTVPVPQISISANSDTPKASNKRSLPQTPSPSPTKSMSSNMAGPRAAGGGTTESASATNRSVNGAGAGSNGLTRRPTASGPRPRGLACAACAQLIAGRAVSAMRVRWHPDCFACNECGTLLEHVSAYERDEKPWCHLCFHERFAPRCYQCETPIVDERFITLDDPALGKRTYHEQHFFCAECGDPFLAPSSAKPRTGAGKSGELNLSGDGTYEDDDVGFTVYRGHPYCEACHVRLRLPKCSRCKRAIREGTAAVEALGGKWCWSCFVCTSCEQPFENPSFFERDKKPYCEPCFSIIVRNEV